MLQLDAIYKAAHVLKEVVRRTDLIYAPQINPESTVYLKPENLQLTGSFKVRGAYYKISQLSDEEKARGVIACSAGNHAQGVALAATKCGIKSLICLPEGAPISKVEATKHYGAEVCLVPGVYDDAYQKALQLRDEKGYTFVHPFDDENVIGRTRYYRFGIIGGNAGCGGSHCSHWWGRTDFGSGLCVEGFETICQGIWRTGVGCGQYGKFYSSFAY